MGKLHWSTPGAVIRNIITRDIAIEPLNYAEQNNYLKIRSDVLGGRQRKGAWERVFPCKTFWLSKGTLELSISSISLLMSPLEKKNTE